MAEQINYADWYVPLPKLDVDYAMSLVDKGDLSVQKHPDFDAYIWNYTKQCQYDNAWERYTVQCRGLITDKEGNILYRPFAKFFNVGQNGCIMPENEKFEVSKKEDGSLGILYWNPVKETWGIATRGSFKSEQAAEAMRILKDKYNDYPGVIYKGYTYLFEIISPETKVVLEYNGVRDLILLAIINNETGKDEEFHDHIPFPKKVVYDGILDFNKIMSEYDGNSEGFVIRFKPSGLRAKLKYEEYKRKHFLMTQMNARRIWWQIVSRIEGRMEVRRTVEKAGGNIADFRKYVESIAGYDNLNFVRNNDAEGTLTDNTGYKGVSIAKLYKKLYEFGSPTDFKTLFDTEYTNLTEFAENVPDEFDVWFKGIVSGLTAEAKAIENKIVEGKRYHDSRFNKEQEGRQYFEDVKAGPYADVSSYILSMRSDKISENELLKIWKQICPPPTLPTFRVDEE